MDRSLPLDIRFAVKRSLSSVLGYQIFSAICRVVPELHELPWGLIIDREAIGLRISPDHLGLAASLSHKVLTVSDRPLSLGTGTIHPLQRTHLLYSPIVIQKNSDGERLSLYAYLQHKLEKMNIQAGLTLINQRSVAIKDDRLTGWECVAIPKTYADSIQLQTHGIGSNRHFGGGVFVPFRPVSTWGG